MSHDRIRVGVLGAGAIAQMMHLPYLRRHHDAFELVRVADLDAALARSVAKRFGIADATGDPAALTADDIDAVVIATSGTHGADAARLAEAGKHLLVEKPLCYTPREANAIARARDRAGVVVQVGYMKRFDPAFRRARDLVASGPAPRLLQVDVLHPRESRYIEHHRVLRGEALQGSPAAALRRGSRELARETLGERPDWALDMYTDVLLGSLVHDVNATRHLVGEPRRVLSAWCWNGGRAVTAELEYDGGLVGRMTWCAFQDDLAYSETIAVHGDGRRLALRFPSPYLEHAVTALEVQERDGAAVATTGLDHGHAEAFEEELLHFERCVRTGAAPLTPVEDATQDIAVLRGIALAALDGGRIELPEGPRQEPSEAREPGPVEPG